MATGAASRGFASDSLWQQAQACFVRGQVEAARRVLAGMQKQQPVAGLHAHPLAAQIAWREDRVRDGTRPHSRPHASCSMTSKPCARWPRC